MPKPRGLGRGLESLIPSYVRPGTEPAETLTVPIDLIKPSRYQPRSRFNDQDLAELSESIKAQGVIQPIIVTAQNGVYELIAGERRLRAAKLAGLSKIPVVIRKVTDQEQFVIALIENIQREDLNPIEEARAYRRLISEFNLTQEALATRIGKGRVVIANTLRLLSLPEHIQIAVSEGAISAGHARSLVSIGDAKVQEEAAERILKENLTVRDVEKIVSDWKEAIKTGRVSSPLRKDPQVRELESSLEQALGTKVVITSRGKAPEIKGQLKLSYFSLSDLERLVGVFQNKQ